jgi:hypothetical protein
MSSLVLGIVKSTPFQMRRSTVDEDVAAKASTPLTKESR